jgi:hypothetical protein
MFFQKDTLTIACLLGKKDAGMDEASFLSVSHTKKRDLLNTSRWIQRGRSWACAASLALTSCLMTQTLLETTAWGADKAQAPAVLVVYTGNYGKQLQEEVVDAIPKGIDIKDGNKKAVARLGIQKRITFTGKKNFYRDRFIHDLGKAAKDMDVRAILVVSGNRHWAGKVTATILLVEAGADKDALVEKANLKLGNKKTTKEERTQLLKDAFASPLVGWADAAKSNEPTEPPPETKKTDEPPPEENKEKEPKKKEKKPSSTPSDRHHALFTIMLGGEGRGRHFSYKDPFSDNLRSYDLGLAPSLYAGLKLFPLAKSDVPVLKDLGITGHYLRAVAVNSELSSGQKLDTTWQRFQVGLRYRIHTSKEPRSTMIGIDASYGKWDFTFAEIANVTQELPSIKYSYLRLGADVQIPVSILDFIVGAAYMPVLSFAPLADRFPNASVGGLDLHAGIAIDITGGLFVQALAQYTRFFYKMNPEVGDTFIAGGALDEYLGGQLALGYAYLTPTHKAL